MFYRATSRERSFVRNLVVYAFFWQICLRLVALCVRTVTSKSARGLIDARKIVRALPPLPHPPSHFAMCLFVNARPAMKFSSPLRARDVVTNSARMHNADGFYNGDGHGVTLKTLYTGIRAAPLPAN